MPPPQLLRPDPASCHSSHLQFAAAAVNAIGRKHVKRTSACSTNTPPQLPARFWFLKASASAPPTASHVTQNITSTNVFPQALAPGGGPTSGPLPVLLDTAMVGVLVQHREACCSVLNFLVSPAGGGGGEA